mgnify:CR=1 FL=1
MSINFNEKSLEGVDKASSESKKVIRDAGEAAISSGERTRFVHKPNPLVERAYQVFEYNMETSSYDHGGDYVLINKDEKREVTEKKVINLMTILNGKDDLIDISNLTNTRLLYTIVPEAQAGDQTKMMPISRTPVEPSTNTRPW